MQYNANCNSAMHLVESKTDFIWQYAQHCWICVTSVVWKENLSFSKYKVGILLYCFVIMCPDLTSEFVSFVKWNQTFHIGVS